MEIRKHQIPRGLNSPLRVLGIDKGLFWMTVAVSASLIIYFASFFGAIAVFLILFVFAYWASGDDPVFLVVIVHSAFHKKLYDPLAFENYELRWK